MAPKAERYDPKNPHANGCKRLCCGGNRIYDPRDNILQTPKTNYLKNAIYTLGVIALLSLIGYCSQPNKEKLEERPRLADISRKLD